MSFAILRIKKHKSVSSMVAAERHGADRERIKHLSHPERTKENRIYKKEPDLSIAEQWHKDTEKIKVRKNAVFGLEIVTSFSGEAQIEEQGRINEWRNDTLTWIAQSFGGRENILQSRIEFDETTIHMHTFVIPLYNGKLNAREYVGDKTKLSKLQDSYAEKMEKYGLIRGRHYLPEDEKPRNIPLKKYYADLEEKTKKAPATEH